MKEVLGKMPRQCRMTMWVATNPHLSSLCLKVIICILTVFVTHRVVVFHQCGEICMQTNILSLQFSNRSLIPNMTNMSVLLRSAETSPSRARGLFFFYTEWPGKDYFIKTTQSLHFSFPVFSELHIITVAFILIVLFSETLKHFFNLSHLGHQPYCFW